MARSIEQIEADIQELQAEKADALQGQVREWRRDAADIIQKLHDADSLPRSIEDACTGNDGTFNPRRTFAIRGGK